jgi:hypothetical protein
MSEREKDPPASSPTGTGKYRGIRDSEADMWQTHQRGVRNGTKAGQMQQAVAYLGQRFHIVESQADALTTQQAIGDRRLTELEKDMTALQAQLREAMKEAALESKETRNFIARVSGSLATMQWLVPVLITIGLAAASSITYLVSHK